jgi:hypothetical protein
VHKVVHVDPGRPRPKCIGHSNGALVVLCVACGGQAVCRAVGLFDDFGLGGELGDDLDPVRWGNSQRAQDYTYLDLRALPLSIALPPRWRVAPSLAPESMHPRILSYCIWLFCRP